MAKKVKIREDVEDALKLRMMATPPVSGIGGIEEVDPEVHALKSALGIHEKYLGELYEEGDRGCYVIKEHPVRVAAWRSSYGWRGRHWEPGEEAVAMPGETVPHHFFILGATDG